ncbi:hypothetical protein ABHF33_15235 [Chitinibacter sp. FCG-7]|uniref:Uncharacterized protein n=1 Tax=Chitinibacter mangrovi TaxID=3153927 RepID=A0AAU7FA19_9NEIS
MNRRVFDRAATLDLFNPSIGDYVLQRYKDDVSMLRNGMQSLRSESSLTTLLSLQRNGDLSKVDFNDICNFMMGELVACGFEGVSTSYVSLLCLYRIIEINDGEIIFQGDWSCAIDFILLNADGCATYDSFVVIEWALSEGEISNKQVLDFVEKNVCSIGSDDEIRAASSLISSVPTTIEAYQENVELLKEHVINLMCDNFCEFIEVSDAFSKVGYGEYDEAEKEIKNLIKYKLSELNVNFLESDIEIVAGSYSISYELDRYYEDHGDDYSYDNDRSSKVFSINEVDELFDRS